MGLCKNTLVVTALLVGLFPIPGRAGLLEREGALEKTAPQGKAVPLVDKKCSRVTIRALSDFLDAQGTLNNPPQFFPPVKDYVGWADAAVGDPPSPTIFGLVDYAGLADKHIKSQTGRSLGTKTTGLVTQCKLADGTAQITVALATVKALGFAQSFQDLANNDFDFLNTPTIFGNKAQDVVGGESAAVGPVTLVTTFSISAAPGTTPLPDFLDVVNNPANYAPVSLNFLSTTFGKCSNGKNARLDVHQAASTNDDDELVFTAEKVEVVVAGGGNCID